MQGVYHPTKMISLKREERKSRDGKYEIWQKHFLAVKNKNLQMESVSFMPKKMNGMRPIPKYIN